MTQELMDLRTSILEGRYSDALLIVDELEGMSKQAILRTIESFLVRMLMPLIYNQLEQRLTNSWAASIRGSLVEIKKLNLKDNKTSYYVKSDEWEEMLADVLELAIRDASVEVMDGDRSPFQLSEMVDRTQILQTAMNLIVLIYEHERSTLPVVIDENLAQLPGGEDWKAGKKR